MHADILPELQAANGGFGDEKPDFYVFGRQELNEGAPGGNPFARAIECVEDEAVTRGGDLLLLQLPFGLLHSGTVGGYDSRLRLELLLATGKFGHLKVALVLADDGVVRWDSGAPGNQVGLRDAACGRRSS